MAAPEWIEPALATLVKDVPDGEGWVFEHKHDGIRCLAHRAGDRVGLFTRNRNPIDDEGVAAAIAALPTTDLVLDDEGVAAAIAALPTTDLVLDGELVGGRFGRNEIIGYHVFDLLRLDGRRTTELPQHERRRLLEALVDSRPPLLLVDQVTGPGAGARLHRRAADAGWEGIVAKRVDAPYVSGRTRNWLKVKCVRGQELVIGGFTEPTGSRVGLGALLVGHFDEDGLRYAGKVGTGFTDALLVDLRARLDDLEVDASPFADRVRMKSAHWVRPELVCDVEFTDWTGDGRLRHPSFKGLRADKAAIDVHREAPR